MPTPADVSDFSLSNLGFQVRYRYELAPLSDLYVVYSRGGLDEDDQSRSLSDLLGDATSLRDAEQILVTFGLAIVLQELVKTFWGANPIPVPAPPPFAGSANVGAWLGLGAGVVYPWWRLIYFAFSAIVIALVVGFLQFTTYGMVVRAGMRDRDMVALLGVNIQRRFTVVFGIAAVVAGLAGVMYAPMSPGSLKSSIVASSVRLATLRSPRAASTASALASSVPPTQKPSAFTVLLPLTALATSIAASTPSAR